MRRVVVTGMGMVTPLGDGVDTNWRRLIAAESGIRSIQVFDTSDLATKIAGEVPKGDKANGHFNVDAYIAPKDQRKLDKFIVFGLAAAEQAVEDSGWKPQDEEGLARTGVMIGSGIGGGLGYLAAARYGAGNPYAAGAGALFGAFGGGLLGNLFK